MSMNRETSQVVLPVLRALDTLGFFVVWTGGRQPPASWANAQAVLQGRKDCPGIVWRQNVGGTRIQQPGRRERLIRFNLPGMADIGGIGRNGALIAIECKNVDGSLTRAQIAYLQVVGFCGGLNLIVRSAADILARRTEILERCLGIDRPEFPG